MGRRHYQLELTVCVGGEWVLVHTHNISQDILTGRSGSSSTNRISGGSEPRPLT